MLFTRVLILTQLARPAHRVWESESRVARTPAAGKLTSASSLSRTIATPASAGGNCGVPTGDGPPGCRCGKAAVRWMAGKVRQCAQAGLRQSSSRDLSALSFRLLSDFVHGSLAAHGAAAKLSGLPGRQVSHTAGIPDIALVPTRTLGEPLFGSSLHSLECLSGKDKLKESVFRWPSCPAFSASRRVHYRVGRREDNRWQVQQGNVRESPYSRSRKRMTRW